MEAMCSYSIQFQSTALEVHYYSALNIFLFPHQIQGNLLMLTGIYLNTFITHLCIDV